MNRFLKSFKFAAKGLSYTIATQPNFIFHVVAAVLVVAAGWYFDISKGEWLAVLICIGLVMVAELLNTAFEALVDWLSPEFNVKAGLVKDIAAGAVLVAALVALVVAFVIFVPKIF
ncbi:diacylglycerol kinase family protein [Pedobacter chitinilyticus]|uniref:Diacylglycerol kinase family protein n=1 Tax=Pedobacter chitinilyticus TaxID=2233776 RepID=A0A3S3PAV3_9SPHI|nr:diacylglycerol kinase family protein [Pedobacter chitinilyticus]RWU05644.1 diacylglycerol kinase family protein [Pedobacter chitinilyticus]